MTKLANTGTNIVSSELLSKFSLEVVNYVKLVQKATSGETLFGKAIAIPNRNLNDITSEYIKSSTANLVKQGAKTTRAKSISKYVFENALETALRDMGM